MKPSGKESGLAGVLSVATHREVFQSYSLKRAVHSSNQAEQHRLAFGGLIRLVADEPADLPSSGNDHIFLPSLISAEIGAHNFGNSASARDSYHGVDATLIRTFQITLDRIRSW